MLVVYNSLTIGNDFVILSNREALPIDGCEPHLLVIFKSPLKVVALVAIAFYDCSYGKCHRHYKSDDLNHC